jgi:hypothetical protein
VSVLARYGGGPEIFTGVDVSPMAQAKSPFDLETSARPAAGRLSRWCDIGCRFMVVTAVLTYGPIRGRIEHLNLDVPALP